MAGPLGDLYAVVEGKPKKDKVIIFELQYF
jgi:hypothetical protein